MTPEAGLARPVEPRDFSTSPELMIWQTREQSLAIPREELEDIQLQALRARFRGLKERVRVLARLADEQGIEQITTLEDGAKLLFKHSVYKSYPLSIIENGRFDRLTTWLGNLTAVDLSGIDTAKVETIDDWLDLLANEAGIRIVHSTGTGGKLSFLPRARVEQDLTLRAVRLGYEGKTEVVGLDQCTFVVPSYRLMYNGYGAGLDAITRLLLHGDEARIVTLFPGRLSADVLSLGGRLSAAQDQGHRGESKISSKLLARRDEFIQQQKTAPARRAEFFDTLATRLKNTRVAMSANWTMLYEMAEEGLAKGFDHVFAPDSLILVAGGTKGKVLPADFKEAIKKFLGVDTFREGFGMSEMISLMPKCESGNYHAMPWMILYLLDGKTGDVMPRSGTHVGRFGVIDLCAQTYWGGFLSGDEVTMTFDTCSCGRSGTTIADKIRRFSEIEGGDDKITCAGAPEAHDKALAFLADLE